MNNVQSVTNVIDIIKIVSSNASYLSYSKAIAVQICISSIASTSTIRDDKINN